MDSKHPRKAAAYPGVLLGTYICKWLDAYTYRYHITLGKYGKVQKRPVEGSPFPIELGKCTEFFLCHSGHELPGLYLCVNLHTIQEGTIGLC